MGDNDSQAQDRDDKAKDKPNDEEPQGGDGGRDAEKPDSDKGGDKPEEDDGPPLYKRPLFWIIGGIVLAVLVVGGILYWLHARQYVSTDDAFVDAHIVRIAPEVSGKLLEVADADNRHVRRGQLLAIVEPFNPEAQLAQARASVLEAIANVRQQQAAVASARADRAKTAADAVAPAADAARYARDYARYQELKRIDPAAAAATQVDQARADAERTAGQAAAARRQVLSADAQIVVARRRVDAARAQVDEARARVEQAMVTYNQLRLVSPVDGQVVNRSVNVGSYVAPGQQLMAIVPDRIWVTANFKETQLVHMRRGQHVDIRVDAFPQVKFTGHVDSIQRGAGEAFAILPAQNATGNYVKVVQRVPVRILFDGPDPRRWAIGPGMSVVPTVKVR